MRQIKFRQPIFKENKEFSKFHYFIVGERCGKYLNPTLQNSKDLFIFQQYTGLKDKKGADVYEGDIVKMDDNLEQFKGTELYDKESVSHHEIYWDNDRALFTDIRLEDGDSLAGYLDGDISFVYDGEVVGNIYSNLEFKQWFN